MIVLKIGLWIIALTLVSAVGAVALVAAVVDANDYKADLAAWVQEKTGRELRLAGDIEVAFFPWLGVRVGAFELSNHAQFGAAPMVAAEAAEIKIELLPLLKKQIKVGPARLLAPRINLARNAAGTANWDDLQRIMARHGGGKNDGGTIPTSEAGLAAGLAAGLVAQGVSITDGRVRWDDAVAGRRLEVSELQLDTGVLRPGQPLQVRASAHLDSSDWPEPAALALTATVHLAADSAAVQVRDVALEFTADSLAAGLSIATAEYALSSGQIAIAEFDGEARHAGNHTTVRIPAATYDLSSDTLQAPAVHARQADFSFSGDVQGGNISAGWPAWVARGSGEARFDDVADLLTRNGVDVDLPSGLFQPMAVTFDYAHADGELALNHLTTSTPDGAPLLAPLYFVIPLAPFHAEAISGGLMRSKSLKKPFKWPANIQQTLKKNLIDSLDSE